MSINKFIDKFGCYLGLHQYKKGVGWSINFQRYDECKCCTARRYITDEKGHKDFYFKVQMFNERRHVLIEKNSCQNVYFIIKENTFVKINNDFVQCDCGY